SWATAPAAACWWLNSLGRTSLKKQRLVRPQDQVLVHYYPYREAGPDSERRLDTHIAFGDLLADLVHRVLRTFARGDDDAIAIGAALRCSQFGTDSEQCGQRRASEDAIPMPIEAIFQPGITRRVDAGQTVERNRRGIGQDQPRPHQQYASLAE